MRNDILSAAGLESVGKVHVHDFQFQALSWHAADEVVEPDEDDEDEDEDGRERHEYVIRAFGVTSNGLSACLVVRSFTPHFYVKVDPRWTPGQSRSLREFIMSHKRLDVVRVKGVTKKDFYGFRNGLQESFLRLDFKTLRGMKIMADKLKKPVQGRGISFTAGEIKLYESNIEPLIRFMHMRDLQPAGWVSVSARDIEQCGDTTCGVAYSARWTSVNAQRGRHDSAPFIVASFDIECNSSHGDFPSAKKDYTKLATELSDAFKQRYTGGNEYEAKRFIERCLRHALTAGKDSEVPPVSKVHLKGPPLADHAMPPKMPLLVDDIYTSLTSKRTSLDTRELLNACLPPVRGDEIIQIGVTLGVYGKPITSTRAMRHIFVLGGCEDVEGATVYTCATERELLTKWAAFVGKVDPDVLVGYNIMGFDMEYIFMRATELSCDREVLRSTSRLRYTHSVYKESNLSSSALGDNLLKIIDMPGRVTMDLMKVVQRDHKLDSYKLDSVAEHFTGSKKNDVSPADIFKLQRGSDADRAVIAAYCVQDCELVLRLAWKLEIMANNIGMANVCSVPLMYIFMRGQGVKIFSLVAKQCKLDNFLVPTMAKVPQGQEEQDEGYEGAIVLEPQAGIYMEPVSVLDYASLYPSSMISENLSHDSIVLDPNYASIPGVEYLDITYDLYERSGSSKVKVGEKVCRFAQDVGGSKAVIPRILQNLIGQRKATRKMIEHKAVTLGDGTTVVGPLKGGKITDVESERTVDVPTHAVLKDAYTDFQKAVLDGLQQAYKVTANSLYGALGARTNPLYLKDIAACTTATGRSLILKAKAFVQKEFGARVIYGDTDSIFCIFNNRDDVTGAPLRGKEALRKSIENGVKASNAFKPHLKAPHDLEYEKTFYPFVILSKKRYVGNLYEHDVKKFKQKSMGIVLKRRDNANIVKRIYGGIIDIILNRQDVAASVAFLKSSLDDLVNGKCPIQDLVITKSLRASYKDPEKIAHQVLAKRMGDRDPGNRPQASDRIPFVYIVNPKAVLQGDRIEHPDFVQEKSLKIDYRFYIEHQIMKPVIQLYAIVLEQLAGYNKPAGFWEGEHKRWRKEYKGDVAKAVDKVAALREREAQRLLFDPVILELDLENKGLRKITDFFGKRD